jgi:hypothetical protein
MTDAPREHLIILESSLANQALGQLEAVATVTQVLPPRLVLIRADSGVRERLIGIAGVMGVYNVTPPGLPSDLTRMERVFISAWEARQRKSRPGEGLPWDSPGFVAPDAPTDSTSESSEMKKRPNDKEV